MYGAHRGRERRYLALLSGVSLVASLLSVVPAITRAASDEGQIAFVRSAPNGGDSDIWVVNADGSSETQLTVGTTRDESPTWSPDGSTLAFSRAQGTGSGIWLVNANGRNARQLTLQTTFGQYVQSARPTDWFGGQLLAVVDLYDSSCGSGGGGSSTQRRLVLVDVATGVMETVIGGGCSSYAIGRGTFSPDGTRVAYEENFGFPTIRERDLTTDTNGWSISNGYAPDWSPVGNRVAYLDMNTYNVVVREPDGTISSFALGGNDPHWAPDASGIVVSGGGGGGTGSAIRTFDMTTSVTFEVTDGAFDDTDPAWGPGVVTATPPVPPGPGKVAYATDLGQGNYEIYAVNDDGSDPVRLTTNPARDDDPVWSPDGSRIAFSSDREGMPATFIMDADGTNLHRLNPTGSSGEGISSFVPSDWSADGTKLLGTGQVYAQFCGQQYPIQQALLVDLATEVAESLSTSPCSYSSEPTINGDGTQVAFVMSTGTGAAVYRRTLATYDPPVQMSSEQYASDPTWNPVDDRVAYIADFQARVVSPGGTSSAVDSAADVDWSPDGGRLVLARTAGIGWELRAVSLAGEPPTTIATAGSYITGVSWANGQTEELAPEPSPSPSPEESPSVSPEESASPSEEPTPEPTSDPDTGGDEGALYGIAAGGTQTTDFSFDGAEPGDPLEVSVTTPNAGSVGINEYSSPTQGPPAGYALLGQEVAVTAPAATPGTPLLIEFILDATLLGSTDPSTLAVQRNGTLVPPCSDSGAPDAAPDPCMLPWRSGQGDDIVVSVRTSSASLWNVLIDTEPEPSPSVTAEPSASGTPEPTPQESPEESVEASPEASAEESVEPTPNPTSPPPDPESRAEAATETVAAGGFVTTDGEADGAAPDDPVEVTVVSPIGGEIGIAESPTYDGEPSAAGYVFYGQEVDITAASASASEPLVIVFMIDGSILPAGETVSTTTIHRNGTAVPDCTSTDGSADPDPCVASRDTAGDDAVLTVRTSAASAWNMGSYRPTHRVSVASDETPANAESGMGRTSLSGDGRFVAFTSDASNLVPDDTNGQPDVFVRDRLTGTTERVSLGAGGEADGRSENPWITPDGRYVAFMSLATNLDGLVDDNGAYDVFVRDRHAGSTYRVSVAIDGGVTEQVGNSNMPSMSADGRYIAFQSESDELTADDAGEFGRDADVFIHDRDTGITERIDRDLAPCTGAGNPQISADGSVVAFLWVGGDCAGNNTPYKIYLWHRTTDVTEEISVAAGGDPANADSHAPGLSADGRYVAFRSGATNLVPGDTNDVADIFVRDTQTDTTELVSLDANGQLLVQTENFDVYNDWPVLSADGRYVAFLSTASTLVANDDNNGTDVFVRDRDAGTTRLASATVDWTSAPGCAGCGHAPAISADGNIAAFYSAAALEAGDDDVHAHAYVRDLRLLPPAPPTPPESTTETASPDGTVTTDAEGDGATESDPVETSITSPVGGDVTISEGDVSGTGPNGWSFFGQQVEITADAATPETPLVLTFIVDASVLPSGTTAASVQLFRDGELLVDCDAGAGLSASPDPCISLRSILPDGDLQLTARTSHASTWNIGQFAAGDGSAPEIDISAPLDGATLVAGATLFAAYTCSDEASGVVACIGTVADGEPVDTGTVGEHSFEVTARDAAGNAVTASVTYRVLYAFTGFLAPVDNQPTLNRVKAGAAVPIKFQLGGDHGLDVLAAGYPRVVGMSCTSGLVDPIETVLSATANSGLTYDAASETYQYVWKTNKTWAGSCRQLILRLADGTEHVASFTFTK